MQRWGLGPFEQPVAQRSLPRKGVCPEGVFRHLTQRSYLTEPLFLGGQGSVVGFAPGKRERKGHVSALIAPPRTGYAWRKEERKPASSLEQTQKLLSQEGPGSYRQGTGSPRLGRGSESLRAPGQEGVAGSFPSLCSGEESGPVPVSGQPLANYGPSRSLSLRLLPGKRDSNSIRLEGCWYEGTCIPGFRTMFPPFPLWLL